MIIFTNNDVLLVTEEHVNEHIILNTQQHRRKKTGFIMYPFNPSSRVGLARYTKQKIDCHTRCTHHLSKIF